VEASFYRGQIFLQQARLSEALNEFSKVVQRLPDFRAYWYRAKTYFLLKDDKRGRNDIAQYVSLKSDSSGPPTGLAIGKALRELAVELEGEAQAAALRQADDALSVWIAANPQDAEALQHLGGAARARQAGRRNRNLLAGLTQDPTRQLRNMRLGLHCTRRN
jgi:tetratricopeptide (TPR) repeat protein